MNELTQVDVSKFNTLMQSQQQDMGDEIRVPFLKVVYEPVMASDGERIIGKPGSYYIKGDTPVYASSIKMRVLGNYTQWRQTDPDTYKLVNKSLLMTNLNQEPRDMLGGLACGRPIGEAWKAMDSDARRAYSHIKCTRILKGIVSYTGKDVHGNEHTVENAPVQFFLTGWNYMPFDKAARALRSQQKKFSEVWWDLTSRQEGKAWVTEFAPDLSTPAPITQELVDTLQVFVDQTKMENDKIEDAYRSAMLAAQGDHAVLDASLGSDLEDGL